MEFSLEEILTEYRLSQQAEESGPVLEPAPAGEPIQMEEQDGGILVGSVPAEESAAEEQTAEEQTAEEESGEEQKV